MAQPRGQLFLTLLRPLPQAAQCRSCCVRPDEAWHFPPRQACFQEDPLPSPGCTACLSSNPVLNSHCRAPHLLSLVGSPVTALLGTWPVPGSASSHFPVFQERRVPGGAYGCHFRGPWRKPVCTPKPGCLQQPSWLVILIFELPPGSRVHFSVGAEWWGRENGWI